MDPDIDEKYETLSIYANPLFERSACTPTFFQQPLILSWLILFNLYQKAHLEIFSKVQKSSFYLFKKLKKN